MFNRRMFFASLLSTPVLLPTAHDTSAASRRIALAQAGIGFAMVLRGQFWDLDFEAPTTGWLALGFGHTSELAGTRFLIAAQSQGGSKIEEHLASPPHHHPVQQEGLSPLFYSARLSVSGTRSRLTAKTGMTWPTQPSLDLNPGATAYLMLAWSHQIDFNHHSAWRETFPLHL